MRNFTYSQLLNIPKSHLPLLALTDNALSWFGLMIRKHQRGLYNHSMWLYRPRTFASQEIPTYRNMDVKKFAHNSRIKLWHNPNWTEAQKATINVQIATRLAQPWYRRLYDFAGILGHFINKPSFHSPWQEYCSEGVGSTLALIDSSFLLSYPTPSDINKWCKDQDNMQVYGYYEPETLTKEK